MQITFHGAAQTVTGSQFLVQVNGKKLLVDCGLYQGKREESYRRNLNFAFDPAQVDAAILSHAHIDHCGNFPNLVKKGFAGPIYATPASADLADIMLRDSGHIQESDAEFINKHPERRGGKRVEPLYTIEDAIRVSRYLRRVEYDTAVYPDPGGDRPAARRGPHPGFGSRRPGYRRGRPYHPACGSPGISAGATCPSCAIQSCPGLPITW